MATTQETVNQYIEQHKNLVREILSNLTHGVFQKLEEQIEMCLDVGHLTDTIKTKN